jgi:hypothetical protein
MDVEDPTQEPAADRLGQAHPDCRDQLLEGWPWEAQTEDKPTRRAMSPKTFYLVLSTCRNNAIAELELYHKYERKRNYSTGLQLVC